MQAEIIPINSVARKDVQSALEEVSLEGFSKAVLTIKSMLKCSPLEIVIAANNLRAAGMLKPAEVRILGYLYGWDITQ
jgi:hypothetical protein